MLEPSNTRKKNPILIRKILQIRGEKNRVLPKGIIRKLKWSYLTKKLVNENFVIISIYSYHLRKVRVTPKAF